MNISLAPIILFVYNRLDHTRQTVEALQKNDLASESILYVFADGAKENATNEQRHKVQNVRDYIHTIAGFKKVFIEESSKNKGLASSVIAGVTRVINEHGKVIVVEDDIVTHPFFLRYMNDCLRIYADRFDIFTIGGYAHNVKIPFWYKPDIYLAQRSNSWGWATWKDRWNKVDWNVSDFEQLKSDPKMIKSFNKGGEDLFPMLKAQMDGYIDSWAIRWGYSIFKNDAYCIFPVNSFALNIGMDGSGVHCGKIHNVDSLRASMYSKLVYSLSLPENIRESYIVSRRFYHFHSKTPSFLFRTKNRIFCCLKRIIRYIIQ